MNMLLEGKKAFVSGSTQGIGYAIAKGLLGEGAEVIINGRQQAKLDLAVEKLQADVPGSKVSGLTADFSQLEQVSGLLAKLPEVDILVNNVGIFEMKAFEDISEDDWKRYYEVNVMSGVRLSKHVLPGMLAKGWGRIIFISSESGVNVPPDMIHYGMTKTAALSLSNGLAKRTKGTQVTVNTILGGPTYSDSVAEIVEHIAETQGITADEMKAAIIGSKQSSLLQRFIEPAEIANLAVYLASPLSSATNGSALRADGGMLPTLV